MNKTDFLQIISQTDLSIRVLLDTMTMYHRTATPAQGFTISLTNIVLYLFNYILLPLTIFSLKHKKVNVKEKYIKNISPPLQNFSLKLLLPKLTGTWTPGLHLLNVTLPPI